MEFIFRKKRRRTDEPPRKKFTRDRWRFTRWEPCRSASSPRRDRAPSQPCLWKLSCTLACSSWSMCDPEARVILSRRIFVKGTIVLNYENYKRTFMIVVCYVDYFSDRSGVMRWFEKRDEWQQRSWSNALISCLMRYLVAMPFCECHGGYIICFSIHDRVDEAVPAFRRPNISCTGALVLDNMRHSRELTIRG